MRFEGFVALDGYRWQAKMPTLDLSADGFSKAEALAALRNRVEAEIRFPDLRVYTFPTAGGRFELEMDDAAHALGLMLRRQRKRHRLTQADVVRRIGQTSKNAVARYEQGRSTLTVDKLLDLLFAIAPDRQLVCRFDD